MSLDVTVRQGEVPDEIVKIARNEAEELLAEYKCVNSVHVILDREKGWDIAEVIVHGKRGLEASAKIRDGEMRVSLEKAFKKIEVQLNKKQERLHDRHQAMKFAKMKRLKT